MAVFNILTDGNYLTNIIIRINPFNNTKINDFSRDLITRCLPEESSKRPSFDEISLNRR